MHPRCRPFQMEEINNLLDWVVNLNHFFIFRDDKPSHYYSDNMAENARTIQDTTFEKWQPRLWLCKKLDHICLWRVIAQAPGKVQWHFPIHLCPFTTLMADFERNSRWNSKLVVAKQVWRTLGSGSTSTARLLGLVNWGRFYKTWW